MVKPFIQHTWSISGWIRVLLSGPDGNVTVLLRFKLATFRSQAQRPNLLSHTMHLLMLIGTEGADFQELTLSGTSSMEQLGSRQGGDVNTVHEENPSYEDILLIGQEKCVEDWPEGSPELNPSWKPPGKLRLRRESLKVAVEMEQESREDMDESGLARSDKLHHSKGKKFKIKFLSTRAAKDTDNLNEGWKTVKQWNNMPLEEKELTEKEEAKALALLADRVQGGIHDFNRVFTEHTEGLWQHIGTLNAIADDISSLHKRAKVPSIIIPVNLDTSLNVPSMEMGVAMTGCPSPASASTTDNFSNSMERKNLVSIMEDYKAKMVDINNHLSFAKLEMEKLQAHGDRRKEWTYHTDWEVRRALQIAMVGGDRVTRAVSVVCMVMGELTSFVQGMDSFYIGKDTCELKKSTKREFATKIQEVVQHLQEQHTALNRIREELQDAIGYI